MCGRSSISKKEADLEKRFNAKFYSADVERYNPLPKFNICPTTFVPVITNEKPEQFQFYHWGLELTSWDGNVHKNTINARKESIAKIPLFNESLHERRCILPATSYFEWKTFNKGKTKIPYLVKLKSTEIFSLAALWVSQVDKNDEMINKFVLITQPPTPSLSFVHDRMPGILTPETEKLWLDSKLGGEKALELINGHPDTDIKFHPVSNELNRSFDNKAEFVIERYYEIEEQGSLF